MQPTMPERVDYLIVGAGIQGLAVGGAIARLLEKTGRGTGDGVLVVDKGPPGAGASWSASGSVHRFDLTPTLYPVVERTLDLLMTDPVSFGFQQVGAVRQWTPGKAEGPADWHPDIRLLSPTEAEATVQRTWPDLIQPDGARLLEDDAGGYVGARQMINGLTERARRWGVRIHTGTEVVGYAAASEGGGCVVATTRGETVAGQVVIAAGPYAPQQWSMLDLSPIPVGDAGYGYSPSGWLTQPCLEGDVQLAAAWRAAEGGRNPPLLIADASTPAGDRITISLRHGGERLEGQGLHVRLGSRSPVDAGGSTSWFQAAAPAALGETLDRFRRSPPSFVDRPCAGAIALSPDRFPVVDNVAPSVFWLGDGGLGVRGVGLALMAADSLVSGAPDPVLERFSLARFRDGRAYAADEAPLPNL